MDEFDSCKKVLRVDETKKVRESILKSAEKDKAAKESQKEEKKESRGWGLFRRKK